MENTVEEQIGCMCEYIPVHLREQVELVADKTGAHESQVVNFALQIGLAVLIGKSEILSSTSDKRHGKMRLKKKPTLSGTGA